MTGSADFMGKVAELHVSGKYSIFDMRAAARYIGEDDARTKLVARHETIRRMEKAAAVSITLAVGLLLGISSIMFYVFSNDLSGRFAGVGLMLAFAIIAAFFGAEYRRVKRAERVLRDLEKG